MKRIISAILSVALMLSAMPAALAVDTKVVTAEPTEEDYTQYVDPFVGTDVDYGQLSPAAMTPYPLMKLGADTYPHSNDDHAGYDYSKQMISGFSHTRIEGVGGSGAGGDVLITPTYVQYTAKPSQESRAMNIEMSGSKKVESAEPGYYSVNLLPEEGLDNATTENQNVGSIQAELTADVRTGLQRYTLPKDGALSLVVDLNYCYQTCGGGRDIVMNAEQLEDGRAALPGRFSGGNVGGNGKYTMYFYMETSQAVTAMHCWDGSGYQALSTEKTYTGNDVGAVLTLNGRQDTPLEVKVTVSPISAEQAKQDMKEEIADWNFAAVRARAKAAWNQVLGKVKITNSAASDPDGSKKKLFYTHLYHMFTMPMNATSTNGTYRTINANNEVKLAEGYTHYDSWTLWDDFKKYPIVGLVMPDTYADIVRSVADGLEAGFATWSTNYQSVPNVRTEHAVALLADGVAKGMTDIPNLAAAYAAAKEITDRVSDATRTARVDKMVEYCYDDWCISQLAQVLYEQTGEEQYQQDYEKYAQRAFLYKSLYRADAVTPAAEYQDKVGMGEKAVGSDAMGLLWGKNSDGSWMSGNAETSGSQGLYQGSLWQYTFWAANDVSGMMDLMGGKEAMYRELSYLMGEYAPDTASRMLHTSTNEIDLHSPYLFNTVGRPWRTQYWTHQIYAGQSFSAGYTGGSATKDYLYKLAPQGYLPGMDDDAGTMAAMYVAAAMGLFPMAPGDPTFQLTAPFFEEVRLDVGGGKEFVIKAKDVSDDNIYIQSATFNGADTQRTWLSYAEIARGGELCYQMGSKPSKWGENSPSAPSMSDKVDSTVYEKEQIAYSTLAFAESNRNDGSVDGTITIAVKDDGVTINAPADSILTAAQYAISGVPDGLTPKLTCTDSKTLKLTLEGKAARHGVSDSTDNVVLTLKDNLFNGTVTSKRTSQKLKIRFSDNAISFSENKIEEKDDGSFDTTITANLIGTEAFTGGEGEDYLTSGKLTLTGLPTGLSAAATRTDSHTVTLRFTGSLTGSYTDRDSLKLTFADSAFTGGSAAAVSGSNSSGMQAIIIVSASKTAEAERTLAINELSALMGRADRLISGGSYSDATKTAVTNAVAAAQLVLDDSKATTAEIESARQVLAAAIDGLAAVRNAFSKIELEDADAITTGIHSYNNIGIKIEASRDSDEGSTKTDVVANTFNGAWVRFGALDFGEKVPQTFAIRYASSMDTFSDARVELRLGSLNGEVVATVNIKRTGGWSNYTTTKVTLTEAQQAKLTGVQDVYMVFCGSKDGVYVGNFNWMRFYTAEESKLNVFDAYEKIQLEKADVMTADTNPDNSGLIKTETSKDSDESTKTEVVANTFDGAWLHFEVVDFGSKAPNYLSIRYAGRDNCFADAYAEVHLGSVNGEIVATVKTPPTGAWETYATATAHLTADQQAKLTGQQDLYVVFHGTRASGKLYVGNFNWMQFSYVHDTARVEAESFDSWLTDKHPSNNGPLKTEDGGVGGSVANTFDKSWIKFDHLDFGATPPDKVTINYKIKGGYCPADARLEIRQGDPLTGTLLATVSTPNEGSGWSSWKLASTQLTAQEQANLTGIVDNVYFVFRGDMNEHTSWYIMNLDYVAFEGGEEADVPVNQTSIAMNMGSDKSKMNFTWYADSGKAGQVICAKESDLVNGAMPDNAQHAQAAVASTGRSTYYSNQATVTALEAGTTYAYQLVNGSTKSAVKTFRTAAAGAFSFAYAGDPQIGASGSNTADAANWEKTLKIVTGDSVFSNSSFLLSAGDQVETRNDEKDFDGYLNHDAFSSLPMVTTIGNHDNGDVAYSQHFNVPNKSTYGQTSSGGDSYFVYNQALFMVLNTNNLSVADHQQFMKDAIEATKDDGIQWKIVVYHHSIYSTAKHAADTDVTQLREALPPIFKDLGIDVVLQGHDHVYTRTYLMDAGNISSGEQYLYANGDSTVPMGVVNPNGILYVTANSSSGSKYYDITNPSATWAAVIDQSKRRTISKVEISNDAFRIVTYFADGTKLTDSDILDQFTIYRGSRQALKTLLDEADAQTAPGVTSPVWAALQTAKSAAQKVYDNNESSEEQLSAQTQTMNGALTAWKSVAVILDAVDSIEKLHESDYSHNSWKTLQDAVAAGKKLVENGTADAAALGAAAAAIQNAKNSLTGCIPAYQTIEMENFTGGDGVGKEAGDDGSVICNTNATEWVSYMDVDFGDAAPATVTFRYCGSSGRCYADSHINLRVGSENGPVLATFQTPPTDSTWGTFTTLTLQLDETARAALTGVQNLYLEFDGTTGSGPYIGNFNWMRFTAAHNAAKIEAESFDSWSTDMHPSGNGPLKTEDGGVGGSIANTFDKAWLKYDYVNFGTKPLNQVTINYKIKGGSCPGDARLEIRQGDPENGTLLATIATPNQGHGWSSWTEASVTLTEAQQALLHGVVKDVYVVFRGNMAEHPNWYIMNLDCLSFANAGIPEEPREAVAVPAVPTVTAPHTKGKTEIIANAMNKATTALNATAPILSGNGLKELTNAASGAAGNMTHAQVKAAIASGAKELKAPENKVTAYVRPYLDIQVSDAVVDGSDPTKITELSLSITPMMQTVVSTAANASSIEIAGDGKNAVVVGEPETVTVTGPVVISVPLPDGFLPTTSEGDVIQIKHVKGNDTNHVYCYDAVVTGTSRRIATFTVTHGFSSFTLMKKDLRTLTIRYDNGMGSELYDSTQIGVSTLPVVSKSNYVFNGWKINGAVYTSPTLTDGMWTALVVGEGNVTVNAVAQLTYTGSSSSDDYDDSKTNYTLTFQTNGGSSLSSITKASGTKISLSGYTTARTGYTFAGWYLDSALSKAVTSMTLSKDTTVYAKWTTAAASKIPFTDVAANAYYYDAVQWAVGNKVTAGVTGTSFAPDATCTRAQTVTLLWRAMGSPEPAAAAKPFADVPASTYYYKAVLWAEEKGITGGTSATTFSPNATCTRSQVVTFLWRAEGSPVVNFATSFTDVDADSYYAEVVRWAVSEGVTDGTSATTFAPASDCTRAQIVTFLYRDLNK